MIMPVVVRPRPICTAARARSGPVRYEAHQASLRWEAEGMIAAAAHHVPEGCRREVGAASTESPARL